MWRYFTVTHKLNNKILWRFHNDLKNAAILFGTRQKNIKEDRVVWSFRLKPFRRYVLICGTGKSVPQNTYIRIVYSLLICDIYPICAVRTGVKNKTIFHKFLFAKNKRKNPENVSRIERTLPAIISKLFNGYIIRLFAYQLNFTPK